MCLSLFLQQCVLSPVDGSVLFINSVTFLCGFQTTVQGNVNNLILENLDPDTPYNIKVTAIYADGPGGELEGDGRTGTAQGGQPSPISAVCF